MAGHRRKSGKPTVAVRRARARRRVLWSRLAATPDPSQRVAIAAGYVRAVLTRLDAEQAGLLAGIAVAALVDSAERFVAEKGARA